MKKSALFVMILAVAVSACTKSSSDSKQGTMTANINGNIFLSTSVAATISGTNFQIVGKNPTTTITINVTDYTNPSGTHTFTTGSSYGIDTGTVVLHPSDSGYITIIGTSNNSANGTFWFRANDSTFVTEGHFLTDL